MNNKTVLLGVTGGIAAYKMADFAHYLVKKGYDVNVVMTKNAQEFITPLTFETLTNNPCVTDTFARTGIFDVHHISLAKKTDVVIVAPATANVIGKLANGIVDDALTTQILACKCPKIVAPSMNTTMLENVATQRNIEALKNDGFDIVESFEGLLACGDVGKGKLPDNETLLTCIERAINNKKDLIGKRILVSAGATQESIDPIRYITNHSTGKMGYSMAYECMLRGADVTLISAPTTLRKLPFIETIYTKNAKSMFDTIKDIHNNYDIIIKAAAVSDFTPTICADNKIKKGESKLEIKLKATDDILSYIGHNKNENQFICGFSMETENLIENSTKKLVKKNVDMIVANNLNVEGAGFGVDTNIVTIITKDSAKELPIMSKSEVANNIIDEIINNIK